MESVTHGHHGLLSDVDDDQLMERTADGDEEAFGLLVQAWERPVHAFLHRMLGNREDADDLSQEVFLKVFAQARRYRGQGRFRSWLFRIAGNLARSHLRRRSLLRWLSFEPRAHDPASDDLGPAGQFERQQVQAAVQKVILELPHRQRQALLLRRFQEMSYEEIAATMGISLPAVESLLQRAMRTLRQRLNRKGLLA